LTSPKLPSLCVGNAKKDQVGSLSQESGVNYKIAQILDESTARIIATESRVTVEGSSLVAKAGSTWNFFLISPIVNELREGQEMGTIPGIYIIEGNRAYTSVTGAKHTIQVVKEYDLSPHLAKLKKN